MPQLIGAGDLITGSWQNFRRNLRWYADFVVWFAFLAVIQWIIWTVTRTVVTDKYLRIVYVFLLSVPTAVVAAALTAAMIDFTAKTVQKKAANLRDSMWMGVHRLIPYLWVTFLVATLTIFGVLLVLIPGIIFVVWYAFAQNYVVIEDVRGTKAMGMSRKLVAGRWWSVFVRIVLPTLFFVVASRFLTAIVYLLLGSALGDPGLFFGPATDVDSLSNTHTLITSVIPQVVNGCILPLLLGSNLLLWHDLKRNAPPA